MYNQRQIKMTEKKKLFVLCVALFCFMAVSAQQRMSVSSPDGKLRFSLKVTSESVSYDIDYRKQPLITNSLLGFSFAPTINEVGMIFAQPPEFTGPMNCGIELPKLMPLSFPHVKSPSLLYCNSKTDSSLFSLAVVKFSAKFSIRL